MRYVKWILLLVVVIIIFLQVLHNLETFSTQLTFSLRLPGENPILTINFLAAAILLFASGFGIAIMIEIYFWFKYSRTIRQQNKIIQSLREELESLKPTPATSSLASEATTSEETKTLEKRESAD